MAGAIAAPREDVKPHAPKIVSFEIPMDKIGEVIGPKGKVINALQQETGAEINVDDDGSVGTVTIGAKERSVVDEARRRIELILDPPAAEVGAVYNGKVVNITKFGAFVNILPGRDGLVHISRLGQGRRVERVEDVLELGQEIEVRVDDIDPQGKVSLSLASSPAPDGDGGGSRSSSDGGSRGGSSGSGGIHRRLGPAVRRRAALGSGSSSGGTGGRAGSGGSGAGGADSAVTGTGGVRKASFEDSFDAELEATYGTLGPGRRRRPATGAPARPGAAATPAAVRAPGARAGAVGRGAGRRATAERAASLALQGVLSRDAGESGGVIKISQLGSGLRLVTESMTDVASASVGVWVGTGSRDETPAQSGISHFLEHLLFKGTATRTAREIAEAVDAVGGDMNAYTTKEYTTFYVRALSEHLDLGLDILCDILREPALRPDEVDAERQVILDEVLMHRDEPADVVQERFSEIMFPDHALGREVLGLPEVIEGVTVEEIRRFFDQHYLPGNMVVAAAGDVEHDAVAEGIERRFAGRAGGSAPPRTPPPAAPLPLRVERRRHRAGTRWCWACARRSDGRRSGTTWPCSTMPSAVGCRAGSSRRCARPAASPTRSGRTGSLTPTAGRWPSPSARHPRTSPRCSDWCGRSWPTCSEKASPSASSKWPRVTCGPICCCRSRTPVRGCPGSAPACSSTTRS